MSRQSIISFVAVIVIVGFIFNAGMIGYWTFVSVFIYFACRLTYSIIKSLFLYRKCGYFSRREHIIKMTARLMGLFLISGTVVYAVAFLIIGNTNSVYINNTELIVRSLICSLDMFMLDIDSNILENLKYYPILRGIIVTQTALSFVCTITLFVSLIFSRAKAYYILHRRTKITSEKNHLYIFFGINDNSVLLAKDIHDNDSKSIIVFIADANITDDENDSWNNIVRLFAHRQKTFDYADETHALVSIVSKQLYDINDDKLHGDNHDVLSIIGLDKVRDFITALGKYPDDAQLHIFFLSDEEDKNIMSLINLAKDKTILEIADNKAVTDKIYCHARYNGPNRVIEDLAIRKGLSVEIIDSSHLAIELLKNKSEVHPVRTATLSDEYPATVTKPIDTLIVGFGEVGRDAFRFIYEFGTFIRVADGFPQAVRPSITAIDNRMDVLNGIFETNTPAINYVDGNIILKKLDCNSVVFYNEILNKEKCNTLNYIVLALGDDDMNISLSTNIFNHIRRYRDNMSDLVMMVRCNNSDKFAMMQKIADHYNKGCGSEGKNVICLFGNPKEIYSYNTIIRDELTRRGITFMESYQKLCGENGTWISRHKKLTGIAQKKIGEIIYPNIDNLRKLRRQESQDLANALHIKTKMWLMHQALGRDYDWDGFLSRLFDAAGNPIMVGSHENIYYPYLSAEENEIMLNLAILEHARWNSAHELLGYVRNDDAPKCDERTRRHNCLRKWEELDEESQRASTNDWACDYKSYDFCVVNTSIALSKKYLGNF